MRARDPAGQIFAIDASVASSARLSDVWRLPGELGWEEALALVQSLAELGLPEDTRSDIAESLAGVTLEADGRLRVLTGSAPVVSAPGLAALLREALPEPGKAQGRPPPAALRYTLSRALREVEAPPIVTVGQLAGVLRRFEQADRVAALRAVHRRHSALRPPETRAMPSATRPGNIDDLPLYPPAVAEPAGAGSQYVPAARREAPRAALAGGDGRRRTGGRLLAQVLAMALIIAGGGLLGYLGYSERPRLEATALALADIGRSAWERVRARAAGEAASAGHREMAPSATRSSAPPVQDAPPSAEPARPSGTAGGGAAEGAPEPGVRAEAPGATAATPPEEGVASGPEGEAGAPDRAGRVVEALDAGRHPIFSPSFAFDGSAVFFHQDTPAGSGLREARGDPTRERLHVVSLLDDGARNYHPRLSPDGSLVAFDSDRDGVRGVYLSARDGTNVRRVSGPGYAAVPSWSPDGSRLAFIKAEPSSAGVWNIWVLRLAGGEMTRLTSHPFGQPWGASWFPDGRRICYSHEDRLIVLDTTTGASRVYPSPVKGRLVRTPAVSPDGRRVVFQLYRDGAWLLDVADGSMRRILADPTAEEFSWAPDGKRVAFHSRRDGEWGVWVMGGTEE